VKSDFFMWLHYLLPPPMLCSGPHCKHVAHMLSFLLLSVSGTCGPHPGLGYSTDFCLLRHHPSVLRWLSVSEQMWCIVMQKGHQRQKWKRVLHCLCPVTSHHQWSSDPSHSRAHNAPCHPHRRTTNCQRSIAVSTNLANHGYSCLCWEGDCVQVFGFVSCYYIRHDHYCAECPIKLAVSAKLYAQTAFKQANKIQ
jgi:hypothetical protein